MSFKFNSQATHFDFTNALRLSEASYWAYLSQDKIQKLVGKGWGLDFRFYEFQETQAFLCFNHEVILIAFRGTDSIYDWLSNIKSRFVKSKAGYIHSGFASALSKVWGRVASDVRSLNNRDRTLWITGHSLGGALATITADRFSDNNIPVSGLYTFGQPRVGDEDFAHHLDQKIRSRTFRFINNEDIVPRVPPRMLGYEENGNVFYFDDHGKLLQGQNIWRDKLKNEARSKTMQPQDRLEELEHQFPRWTFDHDMGHYLGLLKNNM